MESSSIPWLEPMPPSANYAEVVLFTRRLEEEEEGCCSGAAAYVVDVPKTDFERMMERAARHAGYGASHRQFKSWHARDAVFENGGPKDVRVVRKRALSVHELPGAPMLACVYEREVAPFSTFDVSSTMDVRYVRRLELRVHRRARLVFETYTNAGGARVRRVLMELALDDKGGGASLRADMAELRRTVENTVQGVLMGVRLKRAPFDPAVPPPPRVAAPE